MSAIWISEPPEFQLDGDVVKVSLSSDGDPVILRLSRDNARRAANTVNALLDAAEMAEERTAAIYAFRPRAE